MSDHRSDTSRARAVGVNHVALEVVDLEETLRFFSELFAFDLRGRGEGRAFLDLGDQFIAIFEGRARPPDDHGHFGLVVDDKEAVRRRLEAMGVDTLSGPFLDFRDPSGNRIQIVDYREIQFLKDEAVLSFMGIGPLPKNDTAAAELRDKGIVLDAGERARDRPVPASGGDPKP